MDAPPHMGENMVLFRFPDFCVMQFDDGQVNIHAISERAVFEPGEFDLLRLHAAGLEHQAAKTDYRHTPENSPFRTATVSNKLC